MIRNKKKRYR